MVDFVCPSIRMVRNPDLDDAIVLQYPSALEKEVDWLSEVLQHMRQPHLREHAVPERESRATSEPGCYEVGGCRRYAVDADPPLRLVAGRLDMPAPEVKPQLGWTTSRHWATLHVVEAHPGPSAGDEVPDRKVYEKAHSGTHGPDHRDKQDQRQSHCNGAGEVALHEFVRSA